MKTRSNAIVVGAMLCLAAHAQAATHYVRAGATGDGSGADWVNAYTALPTNLTRGDVYYMADGAYPGHIFDDPESGTLTIIIRKATVADHGTDTGWQDSYGIGTASWVFWEIARGYYVFDGQTRNADWRSGYGFKVGPSGDFRQVDMFYAGMSTADHIVFRYLEIAGNGIDNPKHDDGIYSPIANDDVTIQYSYIHDVGRVLILTESTTGWTVEYSVLARNSSDAEIHAEGWAGSDDDNVTIRYNYFEDIEGTGFIVMLNRGAGRGVCENFEIYGNVFMYSPGNPFNRDGVGDGAIVAINQQNAVNWRIYNNSFINLAYGLSSRIEVGSEGANGNSRVLVYNNYWWGSNPAVHTLEGCGGCEARFNRYDGTASDGNERDRETNAMASAGAFVDYAGKNFRPLGPTQTGIALSSPYHVDLRGVTRAKDGVWDRGALEHAGATGPVSAPTNLRRGTN